MSTITTIQLDRLESLISERNLDIVDLKQKYENHSLYHLYEQYRKDFKKVNKEERYKIYDMIRNWPSYETALEEVSSLYHEIEFLQRQQNGLIKEFDSRRGYTTL